MKVTSSRTLVARTTVLIIVGSLALLGALAGCGSSSTDSATAGSGNRGGTLVGVVSDGPDSLDPAQANSIFAWNLLRMTNDGLTALAKLPGDAGNRVVPDLAQELPTPTDGGKTYVFHLRKGIRFSTGAPVRPSDVVASFRRIWRSGGADVYLKSKSILVGSKACDAKPRTCTLAGGIAGDDAAGTVTFHLVAPDGEFLQRLAQSFEYVLPAGTPLHPTDGLTPATGPYQVSSYTPHRQVVLARNPRFHVWSSEAQPDGFPDKIVERLGVTAEQQVTQVERGQADFAVDTPPPADRLNELGTKYPKLLHVNPKPSTQWLDLNSHEPPFTDPNVRKAVNLATDRSALVRLWGGPSVAQPTCQVLPEGFPGHQTYCPYTANPQSDGAGRWTAPDLAAARALVAKSRFKGMDVNVWAPNVGTQKEIAVYYQGLLNRLGFKAHTKLLSGSAYYSFIDNSKNHVQADENGWVAAYPAPGNFLKTNFSCGAFIPGSAASYDLGELCDKTLDALMDQASRAATPEEANRLWAQADHVVTDSSVAVFWLNERDVEITSTRVKNFVYSNAGYPIYDLWQVA